jgi:GntR family transcriptional regulator, transcriptional repressor for pyruvate dehydrogenase complex
MQEPVFQALKFRRLSEFIENSIKDSILLGELKVGTRLPTEKQISRQFGVSSVTVREALRGLEAIGIISKKRGKNGGIFVSQTEKHVAKSAVQLFLNSQHFSADDLNEVRRIIEPPCVRIAVSRITPAELLQIEDNIKYCENRLGDRRRAFSEKDFFAIEERNVEFHRMLADVTHNPILALTIDYVEDFLLSFKKMHLAPDKKFTTKTIEDHRIIYLAMKNGDAETAEKELCRHIDSVGIYLKDHN